jgi:hypothetical protein
VNNQPDGWIPIRGISASGLYFVMCERDDPEAGREFRIFWYEMSSPKPRWSRSHEYQIKFEAGMEMTKLANLLEIRGNADEFIKSQSKKRREFIAWKLERRGDMQRESREARRMRSISTYGLF